MRPCACCSQQARFLSQQEFLCGECVTVREAAGAQCTPLCMLCEDASALIFCRNDNANLCAKCDSEMHFSNPLAARHERVPLTAGACATGIPACEAMDPAEYSLPREAITADSLLPLVKNEPLDDFSVPLLVADSPNDSGSTLTVAQCSPLDVEQQQEAPQPNAQQAAVKGEKEIDPFLEWDGALLDFGLELDAFEHEIMSNSLAADGVVPIVKPAESSCCSAASAVVLPDGMVKAESCDGSAACFMGLPYAHSVPAMVPGTMAPPPPQAAYPMMAGAWAQHAVPQYAMQLSMQNQQLMAAPGWTAAYGAAFYGAYAYPGDQITREARHQSIKRYREKRNKRIFEKTIRYQSRKAYAEIRPRIKGRFAKREEMSVGEGAADEEASDRTVPECVRA